MPWPLLAVLAVQAALSASLVRARTAFGDEALYLSAGHLEWSHWLHGAPIPVYQTWFSGAPVIYPPIEAIADSLGGLAAARLLSLVFMLGVTSFVWGAATRLLDDQRVSFFAAALFAALAPTLHLGSFATYDAPALLLLAMATWCAAGVRERSACDPADNRGGDSPGAGQRDQVRDGPLRPHRARRHAPELVAGHRVEGGSAAGGPPRWHRRRHPGRAARTGRAWLSHRDPRDHDRARPRNRYRLTSIRRCVVVDRRRAGPGRHRGRRQRGTAAVAAGVATGRARALGAAGAGRPGAHPDRDVTEQACRLRCLVRCDRGRLPAEQPVTEAGGPGGAADRPDPGDLSRAPPRRTPCSTGPT